ncbi:hypothetical protein LJR289_005788 [Pseudoduganella sp. LjRoot289]|uniref:dCTP deaminase domain-containing protein n=1 Tax=Pseudoduganella sp. LjRoot289 TaxID=3342314 RepID=UPI003ECCE9B5
MILSDGEIAFISSTLIAPYSAGNLRRASYDLTVGAEYLISKPGNEGSGMPLESTPLRDGQSFDIPPHAVCYVRCKEKIALPDDLIARVSLRMTFINSGLMLAAQPPFDPGYNGYVIVMLHNLSNQPCQLQEGCRIVTMEFSKVTGVLCGNTARSNNVATLEQSLKRRVVSSLQDLEAKTKRTWKVVVGALGTMLAVTALLFAVPAVVVMTQYDTLKSRIEFAEEKGKKQEDILEAQNKAIEAQKEQLAELKRQLDALAMPSPNKK